MNLFTRTDRSIFGRWWWTVDRGMLTGILSIIAFGAVLVAAASPPVAERIGLNQYHFIQRHLILLVPALAIMIGVSMLEVRNIWRLSTIVLAGGLLLMVFILFSGSEVKGAQRWIQLPGFSLQPSEFVKPAFAVVAAWLIAKHKEKPEFPANLICAGMYLLVVTLLLLQPDLGMTLVVTGVLTAQIFLAGLPFRYLIVFALGAVVLLVGAYFTFDHVHSRIDRFLDPASGDNYQVEKSLEAFQNGGLLGTGPGQGTVKLSIPDAHADFIFAVAGEELGFVFVAVLISLFGFILLRGFNRLIDCGNLFVVLAAGGLLSMIGLQTLVHMGSSVNLLPTKGMTLPFISYGGSSLLSSALAMGMVLALTRKSARSGIARAGMSLRQVGGSA